MIYAAVASTFIRFFPRVKARYDYGVLIFILTFCLVSISGLRTDEIVDFAQKRFSTIVIGATTCVVISILVYPVWAGEDLHNLVAKNMDKLGNFLEGSAATYLPTYLLIACNITTFISTLQISLRLICSFWRRVFHKAGWR